MDWLESELLGHVFFFAVLRHKRPQVEDQVPCLIRLEVVGERRHGSAVQSGHEDPVNSAIRIAAFWPGAFGKVVGGNRPAEVILKGRGGRAIRLPRYAVALPALHPGKYVASGLDALRSDFRF